MQGVKAHPVCVVVLMVAGGVVRADFPDISGQASGWVTWREEDVQVGARYIPELSLNSYLGDDLEVAAELALDAETFSVYEDFDRVDGETEAELYRGWIRVGTPRLELRGGLQKISFGSAVLFRPLMWFDTLDPRDPLHLTTGVYGLLGRYYFTNNANIWLWALYGNGDLRGWDLLPSDEDELEYGGRFQFPAWTGELALSFHHRQVDPGASEYAHLSAGGESFGEQRIGLDGKWDVGPGIWFEGALLRRESDTPFRRYDRLITIGADYTFDVANGPSLLLEQFLWSSADSAFGDGDDQTFTGLSASYPLTILDRVSLYVYYDWKASDWAPLLTWQRTYDRWQFHVNAFWNPDRPGPVSGSGMNTSFGGRGVQVMLVFNH